MHYQATQFNIFTKELSTRFSILVNGPKKEDSQNPDYDALFEKYMLAEFKDFSKELPFHIRIDGKAINPKDMTPISEYFSNKNWNDTKKEFGYIIFFPNTAKCTIDFELMKTCTGSDSNNLNYNGIAQQKNNKNTFGIEHLLQDFSTEHS